ncbi:MAG: 4-hydroxyproline epimerase [Alphaproteobacteria bacterium]|nr:4-hydroxyproline epimerase [Alphaproteobacteria bacterium]
MNTNGPSGPTWFSCIDGHTCGNPVRLVTDGAPALRGATMSEKRLDFLQRFDWIREALMFEPRGHDMMSGAFLYPPCSEGADASILFIETSGCLPMCGHGAIGAITLALEHGLITPHQEGRVILDAPAGRITADYAREGQYVEWVRIYNVASYLAARDLEIDVPELGRLTFDVAYGGNFYAILEPQENYKGLDAFSASDIVGLSREVRECMRAIYEPIHPTDPTIRGVSHVMWTDAPSTSDADSRNAVFYGDKAIDRSPCGTGSSARMAQLAARGKLKIGDQFRHESYIGSIFDCRIEDIVTLGDHQAIMPSISGWARMTGQNKILVDPRDPFHRGFQVL